MESFVGESGTTWQYDSAAELGRGGFGVVRPGEGPGGRQVAVKVLDHSNPRAEPLERLMREAQIADRIREDARTHLLPVIDHAVDGALLLLVIDRAEGSLSELVTSLSPEEERLQALRDIAAGLVELHGIPILHRDLKPQNVLLHEGTWKLADFGIARDLDETTATLTWRGAGTLPYMAPELFDPPYAATVESDLYAFGCIAYQLWAGSVPFSSDDPHELVRMHKTFEVPALPDSVNVSLRRLIVRLLDKDPASRPLDARAVAEELDRIVIGPVSPAAARLQALAAVHVNEQAAQSAADRATLEARDARLGQRRQAEADLLAIVEGGADLIRQALPGVTVDRNRLSLKEGETSLQFQLWGDRRIDQLLLGRGFTTDIGQGVQLRDDHLLYGDIEGHNRRMLDEPPLGNIVCEVRDGRLVWVLYRYRRTAFVGGSYRYGPENRRHGIPRHQFFGQDVYPSAFQNSGLHVFQKESADVTPEAVMDLFAAALALPDEPQG